MRRLTIESLLASPQEIFGLRELLGRGGLAAIPTETFYAFATDPWCEAGVRRIVRTKVRDDGKPLLVLFSRREHLERLGIDASPATLERYLHIWPAPLTVVFPLREPLAASRGGSTLGVRLPSSRKLRALLEATGPLTGTSVNRSGGPPLDDPDAIDGLFAREVDLLVDGGKAPGGKPSTVLDATKEPPVVLRAGAFLWPSR